MTGGSPRALEQITGSPTVVRGSGTVASLDTFHGRATVLTGTGTVADLVNFYGRATVLTGTGTVADLVNFYGRATVLTGTGTVADLVNFHGRATVLTGTGTVADLVNFHGRATVLTGTGTVASLTTLQGITSGSVTFLSQTVTGLDFSSDTDLDGVASTLQTALRATSSTDLDNVEVDYDSAASAFVVTLPLDSSGVVPTASAAFTGTESDELGLDTATIVNGVDAIVSGTVTFLSQTLTGLDFSAVTDYDGVASTLQTALRGTSATSLDEVEVVYDGSVFVVTLPLDSSGAATSVSAAFTGDDADELGLDTATIVNGVDAITNGTVTFLSQTLTGLDFSGVTDYDGVASVLQTALRATSSTDLDNVEGHPRRRSVRRDSALGLQYQGCAHCKRGVHRNRVRRAGPGHCHNRQRCGRHRVRDRYLPEPDVDWPGFLRRHRLRRCGLHAPDGAAWGHGHDA